MISRRRMLSFGAVGALAGWAGSTRGAETTLGFGELYVSHGPLGLEFSPRAQALAGKPVTMRGFMAPPLKAEADFFVLTREPVALCPFCDSDSDWPADIVVVHLARDQAFVQNNQRIEVAGRLDLGSRIDPKTGFLSRLRLVEARYRRV